MNGTPDNNLELSCTFSASYFMLLNRIERFRRVLKMVYNIRDYWVFGLCPLSGILKNTKSTTFRKLDLFLLENSAGIYRRYITYSLMYHAFTFP
jgi:hypothetical protein